MVVPRRNVWSYVSAGRPVAFRWSERSQVSSLPSTRCSIGYRTELDTCYFIICGIFNRLWYGKWRVPLGKYRSSYRRNISRIPRCAYFQWQTESYDREETRSMFHEKLLSCGASASKVSVQDRCVHRSPIRLSTKITQLKSINFD